MTKINSVNGSASKRVMIGLRYPEPGIRALERIQRQRGHKHFSDTVAEAIDQYIGRELPHAEAMRAA